MVSCVNDLKEMNFHQTHAKNHQENISDNKNKNKNI